MVRGLLTCTGHLCRPQCKLLLFCSQFRSGMNGEQPYSLLPGARFKGAGLALDSCGATYPMGFKVIHIPMFWCCWRVYFVETGNLIEINGYSIPTWIQIIFIPIFNPHAPVENIYIICDTKRKQLGTTLFIHSAYKLKYTNKPYIRNIQTTWLRFTEPKFYPSTK